MAAILDGKNLHGRRRILLEPFAREALASSEYADLLAELDRMPASGFTLADATNLAQRINDALAALAAPAAEDTSPIAAVFGNTDTPC